jgi:hypothetical protein
MKYIFIIPALLLLASPAYGDRYEYRSDVDLEIPDYDSTGISDTIFVPVHVMIEDINFFVGIGTEEHHAWAEEVWIDVYSPDGATVRLNDWGGDHVNWYFFWYDTDREVDGPGHQEEDQLSIPGDYVLDKNYPNPFNSSTRIRFGLPEESEVKIVVYDIVGRKVDLIVNEVMPAGYHDVIWDGKNSAGKQVASGIYIFRMTAPNRTFDRKAILLK